jgi:hypothetical protein
MSRAVFALLIILIASPAEAGSRFGGFRGHAFHHAGLVVLHHHGGRARRIFSGYICGYDCGWGFDSAGYDYGYGGYDDNYGRYDRSYGRSYDGNFRNDYGGRMGNSVSVSNGLTGGYVPDPVGADILPLVIPHNCWVRRAAYDPSGAYFGQVLVNLCRSSDRVTVTGSKARANTPEPEGGTAQQAPVDQSSLPQPPR